MHAMLISSSIIYISLFGGRVVFSTPTLNNTDPCTITVASEQATRHVYHYFGLYQNIVERWHPSSANWEKMPVCHIRKFEKHCPIYGILKV